MTLSELREIAKRYGVQVDEGLLEFLAEVLSGRVSEYDRLWSRIDERLKQEREYQERYFTLLRDTMEKRFELVFQLLNEQQAEMEKRFAEQKAEMDRRFAELRQDIQTHFVR
ncbi:MAG: hypothetical protein NZ933_08355 [Bacteroidia bacterium]|nr:hypothetical protein [Bacteroidia bacterium]